MTGESAWVDGGPAARSRFEATLERREVRRVRRAPALVADIASGLMDSSPGQPLFDISRYRFRVTVTDRVRGSVVVERKWKSDESSARSSLEELEQDLDRLNVGGFCQKYGITLGS
jgi:hypothetical protein